MATNRILPFSSTDTGSNLLTDAEYTADAQRPIGNQPGVARAKLVNKAMRQASLLAAAVAQFIADNQATEINDAMTPAQIVTALKNALGAAGIFATPPQFDNTTKSATTAFVQRALGSSSSAVQISANTVMTAAHVGQFIRLAGTSSPNVTLPPSAGLPLGSTISFWAATSAGNNATILPAGADTISDGTNNRPTVPLARGEFISLVLFSGGAWMLVESMQKTGGTMRGPLTLSSTPAQFDSSLLAATTAFVQRALGSNSGGGSFSASATMTAANAGQIVRLLGTTGGTITLPDSATLGQAGVAIRFWVGATGVFTIVPASGDTITDGVANRSSVILARGDYVVFEQTGANNWCLSEAMPKTGGTMRGPLNVNATPPQFDNSTLVPSTEFVQRALGNSANVISINGTATLTAAYVGVTVRCVGGTAGVITLPSITSLPVGSTVRFWSTATVNQTIVPTAEALISNGIATVPSVILAPGEFLIFERGIASTWMLSDALQKTGGLMTGPLGLNATPPQFDNDLSAASTEFVQRALGNSAAAFTFTGSSPVVLSATHVGALIRLGGSTSNTITLPPSAGLPLGSTITVWSDSTGTFTIAAAGADSIRNGNASVPASVPLVRGNFITFVLGVTGGLWLMFDALPKNGGTMTGPLNLDAAAPQFDSTLRAASTSFVQDRGAQYRPWVSKAATGTLTVADVGRVIQAQAVAPITLTLPLTSAVPNGALIHIRNTSGVAAPVTVQRAGAEVIVGGATPINSMLINSGEDLLLVSNGAGTWFAVSGSAQASLGSQWASSRANDGYQRLPGGLILQWGRVATSASANSPIVFPLTFPTALLGRYATANTTAGGNGYFASVSTNSGFSDLNGMDISAWTSSTVRAPAGLTVWWHATGY